MLPIEAGSNPAIILPVVVLPQPDSPTKHNNSPAGIDRLISSTALMVCPLTENVRLTCSREISDSDMQLSGSVLRFQNIQICKTLRTINEEARHDFKASRASRPRQKAT